MTGRICEPEAASPQTALQLAAGKGDEPSRRSLRSRPGLREDERGARDRRDQRRRRGREDEWPRAVDEEIADDARREDEAADGAERLATGVQGDDIGASLESRGEATALRPGHAGGMGLHRSP